MYRLQFFETVHEAHIFILKKRIKLRKFSTLFNTSQDVAMRNYERFLSLRENENYSQLFQEWVMIKY